MAYSIFLAKLLGLIMVILYGSVLLRLNEYRQIWKNLPDQKFLIMLSGFIALLLGLLLVLTHNIWAFDFRGLITVLGWIILASGILRLLFPTEMIKYALKLISNDYCLKGELIVLFLLGLFLTYVGFTQ